MCNIYEQFLSPWKSSHTKLYRTNILLCARWQSYEKRVSRRIEYKNCCVTIYIDINSEVTGRNWASLCIFRILIQLFVNIIQDEYTRGTFVSRKSTTRIAANASMEFTRTTTSKPEVTFLVSGSTPRSLTCSRSPRPSDFPEKSNRRGGWALREHGPLANQYT